MTFVNDRGEVLNFDGLFALTKRSVSFFNSNIQGDYSVNFEVDNNSVTRKFLNYDGPMMLNQVAFTRQPVTAVRNGNNFARGFIVIQSDNGDTLSCYFISGNSNWLNLLTGLITELDYSGVTNVTNYEIKWDYTNVSAAMSATTGIIFPMVDWGYDLNKGGNQWFVSELFDLSQDSFYTFSEWYPCFYLHTLVSEIAKQNGIKIVGNILSDKLYQSIVLTPFRGDMRRNRVNVTTATGDSQATSSGTFVQYTSLTQTSDPEDLFASDQYTFNRNCKTFITLDLVASLSGGATQGEVIIRNNSTTVKTIVINSSSFSGLFVTETSAISGDVITIHFRVSAGAGTVTLETDFKLEIPSLITVDDYISPEYFLPEIACDDIVKFVINFFGCAVYYDEYSKSINLNIIEKLKPEDADDWSQYYQSHRSNYAIGAGRNNYMRLETSEDTEIKAYNKAHKQKYGEGNIQTGNTLKSDNDILKIPFAASEFGVSKNGSWISNIPLFSINDEAESYSYTAITNLAGDAAYNYSGPNDKGLIQGQAIRIVDDINGDIGIYIVKQRGASGSGGGFTSWEITFYNIPFTVTGTGKLYLQRVSFNQISPRILVVKPGTSLSDISTTDSEYNLYNSSFSATAKTTTPAAHYAKPLVGISLDSWVANVAFENPDIELFEHPGVKTLYFSKISKMIGNPTHKATMLLPESVFQSFQFDRFIYLKTKDLTGYFWVDSINQYQDSNTKVEINLLML